MKNSILIGIVLALPLCAVGARAQQVVPHACNASSVVTGGTSTTAISGAYNGYFILNPLSAADEGLGAVEPLYVNPTGAATATGYGSTTALAPGTPFYGVPNSNVSVGVNAASSGHNFVCVRW